MKKKQLFNFSRYGLKDRWDSWRMRSSEALKERCEAYFNSAAVSGYQYLVDKALLVEERYIWRLVHICSTITAVYMIWLVAASSLTNRTGITQNPDGIPLRKVPFPAVALCSLNLLSKRRIMEFAKEIMATKYKDYAPQTENETVINEDYIARLLGYMGLAYDNVDPPNDELQQIHDMLDSYDLRELMERVEIFEFFMYYTHYDVLDPRGLRASLAGLIWPFHIRQRSPNAHLITRLSTPSVIQNLAECNKIKLSPQCNETIVRCSWKGQLKNCSQLFVQRKTSNGFCCLFNYAKPEGYGISSHGLEYKPIYPTYGQENGLSFIVNPEISDYFYTRMPNIGFKVMIFRPLDYPDVSSGGCIDMYVAPKVEQYFSMSTIYLKPSEALLDMSLSLRGCMKPEDPFPFDTSSQCYLSCKVQHVYGICGCVPFYLPNQKKKTCDLEDEECLRRWKVAWNTAWLSSDTDEEDEEGRPIESNLEPPCSCLPTCEEFRYKVQKYSINLQPDALNANNDSSKLPLKRQIVFRNHSVIHVFFAKSNFVLLQNDILNYWYDWLSYLGGLCGLVLGCSILSIAEVIYFFVFGGPVHPHHHREPPARELYWNELRRK